MNLGGAWSPPFENREGWGSPRSLAVTLPARLFRAFKLNFNTLRPIWFSKIESRRKRQRPLLWPPPISRHACPDLGRCLGDGPLPQTAAPLRPALFAGRKHGWSLGFGLHERQQRARRSDSSRSRAERELRPALPAWES